MQAQGTGEEQPDAAWQQQHYSHYGTFVAKACVTRLLGGNVQHARQAAAAASVVVSKPPSRQPSTGMPPALRSYAERCFATCATEVERAAMQTKLHGVISSALASGQLHAMAWDQLPVPSLFERKREAPPPPAPPAKKPRQCSPYEAQQRAARAERFRKSQQAQQKRGIEDEVRLLEPVKGTCEALEKDYFRLTSAPDPATVRPERVLTLALTALKSKWKSQSVDYDYACNQLKAIRQDLTVQNIKNKFAIHVYETHARIALENADMNEYNQCQTQLKELHAAFPGLGHPLEFVAYRILYYLYLSTCGESSEAMLAEVPRDAWDDPAVKHALDSLTAVHTGNYAAFFALQATAPNMGTYILDMFAHTIRIDAAYKIAKAFRPSLPLAVVRWCCFVVTRPQLARQLGFDNADAARDFVTKIGFLVEGDVVNLKDSKIDAAHFLAESRSLL